MIKCPRKPKVCGIPTHFILYTCRFRKKRMVLKFPAFSCLVVLVNLVGMIEMLEEYGKLCA